MDDIVFVGLREDKRTMDVRRKLRASDNVPIGDTEVPLLVGIPDVPCSLAARPVGVPKRTSHRDRPGANVAAPLTGVASFRYNAWNALIGEITHCGAAKALRVWRK